MPEPPRSPTSATDARPRLLVLASTYPRWPDDSEPGFIHELCLRLAGEFDVRVITPHAPGALRKETMDGVQVRRYRYAPVSLQTLVNDGGIVTNLKRQPWKWLLVPNFLLCLLWTTWRQTRDWRPDIIHAHWLIPQGLVMALLSALSSNTPPYIVTSHGADLFALRAWPLTMLKRYVARRARAITVVSHAMKKELKRLGTPSSKVFVEPMGVDLQTRFTPAGKIIRSNNELLFVGRLVEKKGVRYLLEALPGVLESHPDVTLTIVGSGPEQDELIQQAKLLGIGANVQFVGARPQKELPDFYQRATLFVAPFVTAPSGDQEGLGLVTIEAIGCGCPALVTDLPATRDVIADEEFRVPARSTESLKNSISMIMSMSAGKREKLARKQRERTRLRFDWSTRARSYGRLLNGIIRSS